MVSFYSTLTFQQKYIKQIPFLMLFVILLFNSALIAQDWNEVLNASTSGTSTSAAATFGSSIAMDGDYAVIGANSESTDAAGKNYMSSAGAAYIFKKDVQGKWNQIQKIVASDRAGDAGFGNSVAIHGDYIVIGASMERKDAQGGNDLNDAGAAYVFKKDQGGTDNWGEIKKIVASDRSTGNQFSSSVGVYGDYVIIGAFFNRTDVAGQNPLSAAGAAYIFKKDQGGIDNWGQTQKIVASDRAAGNRFGTKVAIYQDYAIIGAPRNMLSTLPNAGAAYLFKKDQGSDNWSETKKLTALFPAKDAYFGNSVAIYGDYIIVGSEGRKIDNSTWAGEAYIFKKDQGGMDNWEFIKVARASDIMAFARFGSSVIINDNYAIIGAYLKEHSAGGNTLQQAGAAYILKKDQGGTDNWGEIKKVISDDLQSEDYFGFSVAISNEDVLIGAFREDEDEDGNFHSLQAGSAYVFKANQGGMDNWAQAQKVVASDRGAGASKFGGDIAIDGNYAVIGAVDESSLNASGGVAYVYSKNNMGIWEEIKKITASDINTGDKFGSSVAISGDYIVIGAPEKKDTVGGTPLQFVGAAYVFKKNQGGTNNWGEIKKITAPMQATGDFFGRKVAIHDEYILIGAIGEDEDSNEANTIANAGAAYVYRKDQGGTDNWGFIQKISASDRAEADQFGMALAINGDYMIISAPVKDEEEGGNTLTNAGAAYIFKKDANNPNNWSEIKKITDANKTQFEQWGEAVSIYGNYAVVGAPKKTHSNISQAGAAYIFKKDQGGTDNWGELKMLIAAGEKTNFDNFGTSVSINGAHIIIGIPNEDTAPIVNNGAAYIFKKDQGGTDNWGELQKITPSQNGFQSKIGESVSISNNTALIGAPSFNRGHVFFFESAAQEPSITNPSNDTTCTNGNAVFAAVGAANSGGTLSYQWQKKPKNGSFQNIANATNDSLKLNNVPSSDDESEYRVIVTETTGSGSQNATSEAATLTVLSLPSITKPSNASSCVNGSVIFSTTGTANENGTLSYQWQKKPKNGTFQNIANQTTNTLTLSNIPSSDHESEYRIIITETVGTYACKDTSEAAVLSIIVPIFMPLTNDTTCVNENAAFSIMATANANGTLSYQWQQKITDFNALNSPIFTDLMGETNATLNLSNVMNTDNESQYRVIITETVNSTACMDTSNAASLIVSDPKIIGSEAVCSGNNTVTLELVGHFGQVEKWQSSTDENFSNPTDIANTSSTHTVTNTTATTFFRAIIQNAHCQNMLSQPACIIIDNIDVNNNSIPDCQENCLQDIQVTGALGTPIRSGTYKANATITSDGQTEPNAIVNFRAGQSISLTAGFHVTGAKSFLAIIEPCVNPLIEDIESVASIGIAPENKATHISLKIQPNPFKENTQIQFSLPQEELISIQLFDQTGLLLKDILPQQIHTAGTHQVSFNNDQLLGGMYYFILQTPKERLIQKVIRLR